MAKADEHPTVPGKRLLPQLGVGCLLFAIVMGFGTYLLAQWTTPYLRKKNDEYMRTHHPEMAKPIQPSVTDQMR